MAARKTQETQETLNGVATGIGSDSTLVFFPEQP